MKKKKILEIIDKEIYEHRGNAYRDIEDCEVCKVLNKLRFLISGGRSK